MVLWRSLADKRTWHIPDTQQAIGQLKTLFPDSVFDGDLQPPVAVQYPIPQPTAPVVATVPISLPITTGVVLEKLDAKIIIRMPKNDIDVRFILGFNYVRWDEPGRFWIVPNYKDNLQQIQTYFGNRISQVVDR